jgi:hypothetical protein
MGCMIGVVPEQVDTCPVRRMLHSLACICQNHGRYSSRGIVVEQRLALALSHSSSMLSPPSLASCQDRSEVV